MQIEKLAKVHLTVRRHDGFSGVNAPVVSNAGTQVDREKVCQGNRRAGKGDRNLLSVIYRMSRLSPRLPKEIVPMRQKQPSTCAAAKLRATI